jgi:hypothetical protein
MRTITVAVEHRPRVKVQASQNDLRLGFHTYSYVRLCVPREYEYAVGVELQKLGHHVMFRTMDGPGCAGTKVIDPKGLPKTIQIPDYYS